MVQKLSYRFRHLMQLAAMLLALVVDAVRFLRLCLRFRPTLAAENLFLRKQLALYQERNVQPRRATNTTRLALVWLGHWFDWRNALAIVTPQTFTRCHRQGFRLFWRWKSKPGRPALPQDLQVLIRRMALENSTWGQEHIATDVAGATTGPSVPDSNGPTCDGPTGPRRFTP
jgi:putative transposase